MPPQKKNGVGRRDFIRIGSLAGIGTLLSDHLLAEILQQTNGIVPEEIAKPSHYCDILRTNDKMYLRLYFFNTRYEYLNTRLVKKDSRFPVFMYVKLPPQHVAEELIPNPKPDAGRSHFKKTRSFLAGNSWLAFKLKDKYNAIQVSKNRLLAWKNAFDLITLNDFANQNNGQIEGMDTVLAIIKAEFEGTGRPDQTLQHAHPGQKGSRWPLTKFEVPYKMFLSPIAPPVLKSAEADGNARLSGAFVLTQLNNRNHEYSQPSPPFKIVKPWEIRLQYELQNRDLVQPHLKVVHHLPQKEEDNDRCTELIPAPIHRMELNGLTLLPGPHRDVVSDDFRLSAFGALTNLEYQNSDPTIAFSIIAWKQQTRYARDNYASITFRAIDFFTGIKLRISMVGERRYQDRVSFFPKLYYFEYDEAEKTYDDAGVISRIPFRKIVPLSKGGYFFPSPVPGAANAYAVNHPQYDLQTAYIAAALPKFEYKCYDKDDVESIQVFRIIFIPAESYVITENTYHYPDGRKYVKGETVLMHHIGLLDPTRQERPEARVAYKDSDCPPPDYRYKMLKTFGRSGETALRDTLSALKKHTSSEKSYTSGTKSDITFATLDKLKGSVIRADSANATFSATAMLMQSCFNEKLYPAAEDADNFLQPFPILPGMTMVDVVIPQISQIEGKSVYRTVCYARDYTSRGIEMDGDNPCNRVKLLFELATPLDNFFQENYRRAGAVANPGIDIRYISVLDQGIGYNTDHNKTLAGSTAFTQADIRTYKFATASILNRFKAEILGIPLVSILADSIDMENMPAFTFVQQAENLLNRIEQMVAGAASEFGELKRNYDNAVKEITRLTEEIRRYEQQLKMLAGNALKGWMESLVEMSGIEIYYASLTENLVRFEAQYKKYRDETGELLNAFPAAQDILADTNAFITHATAAHARSLLAKIVAYTGFPPDHAREAIRMAMISLDPTLEKINLLIATLAEIEAQIDAEQKAACALIRNAVQEGAEFSKAYAEQQYKIAKNKLDAKRRDLLTDLIPPDLTNIVTAAFIEGILQINQVVEYYRQYRQLYLQLSKDAYLKLKFDRPTDEIETVIKQLETDLTGQLNTIVNRIKPEEIAAPYRDHARKLKEDVLQAIRSAVSPLQHFDDCINSIKGAIDAALVQYTDMLHTIDKAYYDKQAALHQALKAIKEPMAYVENFAKDFLGQLQQKMEENLRIMLASAQDSEAFRMAKDKYDKYRAFIQKIQEFSRQSLRYNFETGEIRKASFAGVIHFVPGNSRLKIDVLYDIEFDILNSDLRPTIKKQSFHTRSSLTDFKIGFLNLLYIDFSEVSFVSGSEIKDDFQVRIRNVEFSGALSFVQAFQEYLKSIDDNLVFDISATGARIGYGVRIPDITAGYFNFFNLSLSALLTLPFDPSKSLQLQFGIGSELCKFGITVSGIFGGQGYFNLIAEPKRGIVGLILVLEFGAIFNLNIGVAWGSAYLVGGIYIRRYGDKYTLKAYVLCVGRLNVLGIFSASVTFYLGMEGDSHILKGRCVVEVSKRLTPFFKIRVKCGFEKTLKGGKSNESPDQAYLANLLTQKDAEKMKENGLEITWTNIRDGYIYPDEQLFMLFNDPNGNLTNISLLHDNMLIAQNEALLEKVTNAHAFLSIRPNQLKQKGEHKLLFVLNDGTTIEFKFSIQAPFQPDCQIIETTQLVNDKSYYASYYPS